ncbi:unnamed protein product [Dicrocoelium dendriticum]|nr:unnamed protein product [Dicrocoelium dendriticum]
MIAVGNVNAHWCGSLASSSCGLDVRAGPLLRTASFSLRLCGVCRKCDEVRRFSCILRASEMSLIVMLCAQYERAIVSVGNVNAHWCGSLASSSCGLDVRAGPLLRTASFSLRLCGVCRKCDEVRRFSCILRASEMSLIVMLCAQYERAIVSVGNVNAHWCGSLASSSCGLDVRAGRIPQFNGIFL